MMCMGNELRGDYDVLKQLVELGKQLDGRHLYTSTANNAAEASVGIKPYDGDEYYIAHEGRINGERIMRRCEMVFNHERPETCSDYRETLVGIGVPTISHEVGQWEIYPNYDEIKKYTGVLVAKNLEAFQASIQSQGLLHQAENFLYASGKLSVLLYKEEIEKSLRTPEYGGFQLLDIHDYPGQGTAHVGWLDTFWNSKGLIEPQEFRGFCYHTVALSRMEKRVWQNNETFNATIEVANYNSVDYLDLAAYWVIIDSEGFVLDKGVLIVERAEQGKLTTVGRIVTNLVSIEKAKKCILKVEFSQYNILNQWEFWVYPSLIIPEKEQVITKVIAQEMTQEITQEITQDIFIAHHWDEVVENKLKQGESVLLFAQDSASTELMSFTPPFWNTQLFDNQRKTLGMFCDSSHSIFTDFPTDDFTNWQWWELLADSKCIKLSSLPEKFEPIVWAIDHPIRNLKLGVIFEASVNSGKLLVTSLDLYKDLQTRPVARQLLSSVMHYMKSDAFLPNQNLCVEQLKELLAINKETRLSLLTKHIQASNIKWSCSIENILTSDPGVFWVTFGGQYPYIIDIELKESVGLSGFKLLPRQDGMKVGLICDYEIYVSHQKEDMGKPTIKGSLLNTWEEQTILFDYMDDGFNVTKRKTGKYIQLIAKNGYFQDNEAAISKLEIITV
jgi:hypothetical protein